MITSSQLRTEVLSGLTIAIALVPEAISFALLAGAAPQVGLWAAVIMALSTAIFGGKPGLISGATGATAVILAALVKNHGMDALFVGVMVAGVIQLIVWLTGLWKFFEKIPTLVISGFLIALAIMIFMSQLAYFDIGDPSGWRIFIMICAVLAAAAAMKYSASHFKFPPALAAIVVGLVIGIPLGLPTVGDISKVSASLPVFQIPMITLDLIIAVLPYSFGVAFSGLTESLIGVGSDGSRKKETFAQGVGNITSSLFGAMGGCVLIGQSNLNLKAGAKHRISGIAAALGLMAIILLFGEYIERVPLVGLMGVMLIVVIQTGDWLALKTTDINRMIIIFATTTIAAVTNNLALGVIAGTILYYLIQYNIWQKQQ
jgi:SulP family sulfate permease